MHGFLNIIGGGWSQLVYESGLASGLALSFPRASITSRTVMSISPCLFFPGHSCFLSTFKERVAPQPQIRSGVASTSSIPSVARRSA